FSSCSPRRSPSIVIALSVTSTFTSSFVKPGRSARTTNSPSCWSISTCGDHTPKPNSFPKTGASQSRRKLKSSNKLSISSAKRRTKEKGVAAKRAPNSPRSSRFSRALAPVLSPFCFPFFLFAISSYLPFIYECNASAALMLYTFAALDPANAVLQSVKSVALMVPFLFVMFQHRAGCHLFSATAVAGLSLGRFFDVLILTLLFLANASHMFLLFWLVHLYLLS